MSVAAELERIRRGTGLAQPGVRLCACGCGAELRRRPGERPFKFARRETTGERECTARLTGARQRSRKGRPRP